MATKTDIRHWVEQCEALIIETNDVSIALSYMGQTCLQLDGSDTDFARHLRIAADTAHTLCRQVRNLYAAANDL